MFDDPPTIELNLAAIMQLDDLWEKRAADTGSLDIKLAQRTQRLQDAGVLEGAPEPAPKPRIIKHQRRKKKDN